MLQDGESQYQYKIKTPTPSKKNPQQNRKHPNRKKTIKGTEYIRELYAVIMEADVKYTVL